MLDALEPTQEPGWVLSHEGYNVLTESAVESRFALGNGFLGMRASRSVSRGPTWLSWLGYIRWASWPRCYVAGLFDIPNTEPPVPALVPIADWSRVRVCSTASRCWRARVRFSPARASSTCAAACSCRVGRTVPPPGSLSPGASSASCHGRTARRGCSCCNSRWTETASR